MNNRITALIQDLEAEGIQLKPLEDSVWLSKENLTAEIINQVKENKPEILFFLRMREYRQLTAQAHKLAVWLNDHATPLAARKEKLQEYESLLEQIADLQPFTDHYQESGLAHWYDSGWLLIHSELLNELVVMVKDETVELPAGARAYPVYLFKEVESLDGKSDEIIRAAHRTKKAFSGRVEGAK